MALYQYGSRISEERQSTAPKHGGKSHFLAVQGHKKNQLFHRGHGKRSHVDGYCTRYRIGTGNPEQVYAMACQGIPDIASLPGQRGAKIGLSVDTNGQKNKEMGTQYSTIIDPSTYAVSLQFTLRRVLLYNLASSIER